MTAVAPKLRHVVFFAFLALFSAPRVHANTINVPANQPTLQAAVAAAASGDTILFAPGTYVGGVWFDDKALVFASRFLTTGDTSYIAQTVLNGLAPSYCPGGVPCTGDATFDIGGNADGGAVIGLTLTPATPTQWAVKGVRSSSVVDVRWCHIIGTADAINYAGTSSKVAGGVFANNVIRNDTDDGIDINNNVECLIQDNVVMDCAEDGIEFRMYPYTGTTHNVIVTGNQFLNNGGDGIQLIDSPLLSNRYIRVERNLFMGNHQATIGCMPDQLTNEDYTGAPIEEKVDFLDNTVIGDNYGIVGGSNTVVLNNVFSGIPNKVFRNVVGPGSIVTHNLVWNSGVVSENSNVDNPTTLLANPLLGADHHLTAGSPAIDAGVPFFQWRNETVLNLSPSAYLGNAPDLGAFEFNGGSPVAHDDAYSLPKGGTLNVAAPGVLGNDTDPNGDPLTVSQVVTNVTHGTLTLNPNGSFQYTHDNSSVLTDAFVYEVGDGNGNFARATCNLQAIPPNAPPTATADVFYAPLNASGIALDVLPNDWDSDGDAMTLQSVDLTGATGTATVTGDFLTYSAAPAFTGDDVFTYTVRDVYGATAVGTVRVKVQNLTVNVLASKIAAGSDDAEESATGVMSLSSSDLEMTYDGSQQTIGVRFRTLPIPRGAQILKAWIQFKVDEVWPDPTSLLIRGEANDDSPTFTTTAFNVSSRPRTATSVAWSPPQWNTLLEQGINQQTPSLVRPLSEIVRRFGWASGHSASFIITGTGHRVAEAFEIDAPGAATLNVQYFNATPVGVGETPAPEAGALRVSPTPARGPVTVEFALPASGPASLELLDVSGRRVAHRDVGVFGPGRHQTTFRERIPAGLYLVHLRAGGLDRIAKAVVLP